MKELPECKLIIDKLINELPGHLRYHTIEHTLDVYDSATFIAKKEGIGPDDLKILQVAAIYHDAGYLIQNHNHEQRSCDIARKYLPQYNYPAAVIEQICDMIMATKIPQNPQTHLEEILCDADLDYLGRNDFFTIGEKLYEEMVNNAMINKPEEWNAIQEKFLQQHHYFTKTAIELRTAEKEKNLKKIQSKT